MQIEEYISELLFEHNCVIVPDFGGFVGNYSPSRIDPVKHLFEPPHKRILFNKNLLQNDGLLANHISHREKISYAEALNAISKAVKHFRNEIKQDKRAVLDNIGVLYTDEQGTLLFQQDEKVNYLPESFGLSTFYQLPVTKDTAREGAKVVELHPKQKSRIRTIAAAAAVTAVITSTFWISLNQGRLGINYSGLNIFSKKGAGHGTKQYNFVPREALPVISYKKDSIAAMAMLTPKVTADNTTAGNYQIIAGCFRFKENALNLIARMKAHNINASIIGTNPQGLYMVGYGKFITKEEANLSLNDFRKAFVADAWVFEKTKI